MLAPAEPQKPAAAASQACRSTTDEVADGGAGESRAESSGLAYQRSLAKQHGFWSWTI